MYIESPALTCLHQFYS